MYPPWADCKESSRRKACWMTKPAPIVHPQTNKYWGFRRPILIFLSVKGDHHKNRSYVTIGETLHAAAAAVAVASSDGDAGYKIPVTAFFSLRKHSENTFK